MTSFFKDIAETDSEKSTKVTASPKDVAVTASLQIQPTQCQRGEGHNHEREFGMFKIKDKKQKGVDNYGYHQDNVRAHLAYSNDIGGRLIDY